MPAVLTRALDRYRAAIRRTEAAKRSGTHGDSRVRDAIVAERAARDEVLAAARSVD